MTYALIVLIYKRRIREVALIYCCVFSCFRPLSVSPHRVVLLIGATRSCNLQQNTPTLRLRKRVFCLF
jgi:hypothetical protein